MASQLAGNKLGPERCELMMILRFTGSGLLPASMLAGYYAKWSTGEAESTMRQPIDVLADYLNLAQAAGRRKQPLVKDRTLLLAGVIAAQIGLAPIAAACREEILRNNRRHLIGRWPTIAVALEEEDFQTLVRQLSTRYGPERVERMVEQLEIDDEVKRADFASDGGFAAALLGQSWEDLVRRFGNDPERRGF